MRISALSTERFDWIFGIIYELPVSFLRETLSIGGNDFHHVYIKIYPRRVRCNRPSAPPIPFSISRGKNHRDTESSDSGLTCIFPIEESHRWRGDDFVGYRCIFPDIDNPWISWPGDYYPGIRRIFRRDSIEKRGGTRLLVPPWWYTAEQKFRLTDFVFQQLKE